MWLSGYNYDDVVIVTTLYLHEVPVIICWHDDVAVGTGITISSVFMIRGDTVLLRDSGTLTHCTIIVYKVPVMFGKFVHALIGGLSLFLISYNGTTSVLLSLNLDI